ncbi:16S rRNA (cytosine(967)-C(5))-methyltransferase RsmB [soil metagenome]
MNEDKKAPADKVRSEARSSNTAQRKEITHNINPDKNHKSIYSDVRACAVKIICRCERTDSYLDKLMDSELRNSNFNDFDKALLNELTHGVIRWMRRLDWFLNGFYRGQYEKCLPEVRNAMRVALYQILFLNKIPYSAAVNEAVEFIKRLHGDKHAGVVNGLLRTIIRSLDNLVWPSRDIDEINYLGMVQSHPNWMVKRWVARFGFDEAEKLCEFNNKRPILGIRVNTTKTTIEEVEKQLQAENFQTRRGNNSPNFITIRAMAKIYNNEMFKQGWFSIQDESAGLPSFLLSPKRGDVILDVCAAPGGKTSHMYELTNGEAKIYAIDKYLSRIERMERNFERTGVTNVTTVHDDVNKPESELLVSELIGKADKILVDAPCSGLGVISKKPDIKWKRELEDICKLQALQIEILENSVKYLKPHGVIVYSTCTTEKEENIDVIHKFLQNHPEFKIDKADKYVNKRIVNEEGCIETFPMKNYIDGAFSCRLIRE